jgi:hypothetical protein
VRFYVKSGKQVDQKDVQKYTSPRQGTRYYYTPAD